MKKAKQILCLLLTVGLVGCSSAAGAAESGNGEESAIPSAETIYGKIKEINGNEILLVLGSYDSQEMGPGDPASPDSDNPSQSVEEADGENPFGQRPSGERPSGEGMPSGQRPQRNAGGTGESGSRAMPEGGAPPSGGRGAGMSGNAESGGATGEQSERPDASDSQPADGGSEGGELGEGSPGGPGSTGGFMGGGQRTFTLTGEEVSYLIPVTATVTTGQGDNAREVRFTQLAVKNVVCLYLDENGVVLALEVLE